MSPVPNPFDRGYQNLRVIRILCIADDDSGLIYRRLLHPYQAHLPDLDVLLFPCIFDDKFALIREDQDVPDDLDRLCPGDGYVNAVVYAIHADDFDGQSVHVGDALTQEAAHDVVRQLAFDTGFYSRCWEINSAHITDHCWHYLANLADIATPSRMLFIAFRIPYSTAMGVKLLCTPWTDGNLQLTDGTTVEGLRCEHRSRHMPDALIEVLHLAGRADIRMLIFDDDASLLRDLPVYRY